MTLLGPIEKLKMWLTGGNAFVDRYAKLTDVTSHRGPDVESFDGRYEYRSSVRAYGGGDEE